MVTAAAFGWAACLCHGAAHAHMLVATQVVGLVVSSQHKCSPAMAAFQQHGWV